MIEVIAPQAAPKNITLHEKLTPVFYQTHADRDMLYQTALNLLSNAVKYTPEGGTITVATTVDEDRKKVITRITDTGVGIPPKDLPFVFDKFYRAEANNRMAKVLKAKGYEYQYLFCRGSSHGIGNAKAHFLPHAIEWVWKGYPPKTGK